MTLIAFAIAAVIAWHLVNKAFDARDRRKAAHKPDFDEILRRDPRRRY